MGLVRAKSTFFVAPTVRVAKGDIYDSKSAVVSGREALFEAVEAVEQATAAPGERRAVKRAPAKKAAASKPDSED